MLGLQYEAQRLLKGSDKAHIELNYSPLADMMKQPINQRIRRSGFSLLELMAVVTIIGIIVSIVLTRIAESTDAAKEKTCINNVSQINSALERFAVSSGNFATAIGDVDTTDYFPGGIPTCAVDGSAYTLNSTTHRVEGHAH